MSADETMALGAPHTMVKRMANEKAESLLKEAELKLGSFYEDALHRTYDRGVRTGWVNRMEKGHMTYEAKFGGEKLKTQEGVALLDRMERKFNLDPGTIDKEQLYYGGRWSSKPPIVPSRDGPGRPPAAEAGRKATAHFEIVANLSNIPSTRVYDHNGKSIKISYRRQKLR